MLQASRAGRGGHERIARGLGVRLQALGLFGAPENLVLLRDHSQAVCDQVRRCPAPVDAALFARCCCCTAAPAAPAAPAAQFLLHRGIKGIRSAQEGLSTGVWRNAFCVE
jgi:hypothetical protein